MMFDLSTIFEKLLYTEFHGVASVLNHKISTDLMDSISIALVVRKMKVKLTTGLCIIKCRGEKMAQ